MSSIDVSNTITYVTFFSIFNLHELFHCIFYWIQEFLQNKRANRQKLQDFTE